MAEGSTVIDERIQSVLDRLYADDDRQRKEGLPAEQRTRNLVASSGRLLMLLARAMNAQTVLEIGSSNAVSTIWFAAAMRETGGRVIGSEIIPERAAEANANLAEAGLDRYATVFAGDAATIGGRVDGEVDLIFIDAEKDDYVAHFERTFPLLRVGGVVIADNVESHDISAYQRLVASRPDCESTTLKLDRGLEMTVKSR
jgi:predicted O-methyltransferase YrrM